MAILDGNDRRMSDEENSLLSRTLADLRRRKVFRVVAAYAVVAWLLIEVSSVVLPALKAPEWTVTAVVVAAMAGFPATLLLAWVFDVTPRGVVRTGPAPERAAEVHRAARIGIDVVVIGVLLAIIAYLVAEQGIFGPQRLPQQSIAVLPFVDVSESGDNEYFSDGISEELLNSLVGIEGLRVAARTSSFAFKDRKEDVRTIGEKLNVRTILEGSVRRAGDQVRITANLIDVDDGFPIWSATYNRRLDDIFAIQDEIARSIVEALRLELVGGASSGRAAGVTEDIKAYDLYLLGRHHWHQRTAASLRRALDLFQQAVEIDPDFALAYTGLADTYLLLDGYGDMSRAEALSRAEPSVARALALDDQLAEAYASLGLLRLNQGDATAAELALRSAINLNPNYSMAHMWLGLVLDGSAGPAESMEEFRRARQLDPLHPVVIRNLARSYASTGRFRDAERLLLELRDLDPREPAVNFSLSRLYGTYGRLAEAARWAWWGVGESSNGINELGLSLAMLPLGQFDRAEKFLLAAERGLGEKKEVLWARMDLYLAQGRSEELVRFSNSIGSEADDPMVRAGALVWSGVAGIISGDPGAGTERLEEGLETSQHWDMTPDDRLRFGTLLAFGYRELGDSSRAEESLARAREEARAARAAGWDVPQLAAWEAVAYYMAGRLNEARSTLQAAVDHGWRNYIPLMSFPPAAGFFAEPELGALMGQVREDVIRMASSVEELENLPSPPGNEKMVQLNR